jgi:hypothetical protein
MAQGASAPVPAADRRPRVSSSTTLVAGVATLLLAMGVGVLIGQNGTDNGKPQAAAPAQVITVAGGPGAGATGGATASTGPTAGRAKALAHFKAPKVVVTKRVVQAAAAAASKVTGGTSGQGNNTVAVGQPASGPGSQNGHFTGNFFGP